MLQMRRIVRKSSSMAGLPPPTKEQEDRQVEDLIFQNTQPKVRKCDLDIPEFETKSGQFERSVVVKICPEEGTQVRYTVERVDATAEVTEGGAAGLKFPTARSPLYRKPLVFDEMGVFVVRAVAFKESSGARSSEGPVQQRSLVATERYVVLPGASGTLLRNLPSQMVHGAISIVTGSERMITTGLGSLKASLAQAANALQSAVHLKVDKSKDSGIVNVGFSIEVQGGRSAQQMVNGLTDASLVRQVAKALHLDESAVKVDAKAKDLEEVLLSLSWTFPRRRGAGGAAAAGQGVDYLDGSCLVYAEGKLLEVVDYRGPQSAHGQRSSSAEGWSAGQTIVHSGDVMSECGGQHALRLRLTELPARITDCIFTLSAYHSQDLSKFIAPSMRIFDADCPDHLLSAYSVADAGTASAVVVCSLTREGSVWSVRAHNRIGDGTVRDYTPIEAKVSKVQERYAHRRRRFPIIRMYTLWQADRALPCGAGQSMGGGEYAEDVLLPLMDLSANMFRQVLEFV